MNERNGIIENGESGQRIVNSIKRASDILDLFMEDPGPLGITDFSKRLSLPKTTIQGIVRTLAHIQYLEQDPLSHKYYLGPKLFRLGMQYTVNHDTMSIANLYAERLSFKLGLPVNAGFLVGNRIIIALRAEPESGSSFFPQMGLVIQPHTTCIGKIIYAFMDEQKREELIGELEFAPLTERSITDPDVFRKELEQVRQDGISYENEENVPGMAGIGGPVFNSFGELIAAFAVTGRVEQVMNKKTQIMQDVQYTSREVSRKLGYVSIFE